MRTTLDIPDHLLVEAKKLAAERHVPLVRLVEESLRSYLSDPQRRPVADLPPLPLLRGPKLVRGIDLDDTSRLWDAE